jgi:hypothetical protein
MKVPTIEPAAITSTNQRFSLSTTKLETSKNLVVWAGL